MSVKHSVALGVTLSLAQLPLGAVALQPATTLKTPVVRFDTSTRKQQARILIQRGLLLYYAYNGPAAAQAFRLAAKVDPGSAMAYWGIALANGPNLNFPITQEGFARGKAAIKHATSLATGISDRERAYIGSMAQRYDGSFSSWQSDDQLYVAAMAKVAQAYPDDDNATMLYLEAVIENTGLTALWRNARYAFERNSIEHRLDNVLRHDPWNPMANHMLVHLYDFAPDRTAALRSADRLALLKVEPDAGHLVHMAAHTYVEQGYYAGALAASMRACVLDQRSTKHLYDAHDYFVGESAALEGSSYSEAVKYVQTCAPLHGPFHALDPEVIAARFYRWSDILAAPRDRIELHQVLRVEALSALGRGHEASVELAECGKRNPELKKSAPSLYAKVAIASGDRTQAVAFADAALRQSKQEPLGLPELTVTGGERETTGYVLYALGRYAQAERVFLSDLSIHRNNGRALFGLWQTLLKDGESERAQMAESAFKKAWIGSDTAFQMRDL